MVPNGEWSSETSCEIQLVFDDYPPYFHHNLLKTLFFSFDDFPGLSLENPVFSKNPYKKKKLGKKSSWNRGGPSPGLPGASAPGATSRYRCASPATWPATRDPRCAASARWTVGSWGPPGGVGEVPGSHWTMVNCGELNGLMTTNSGFIVVNTVVLLWLIVIKLW